MRRFARADSAGSGISLSLSRSALSLSLGASVSASTSNEAAAAKWASVLRTPTAPEPDDSPKSPSKSFPTATAPPPSPLVGGPASATSKGAIDPLLRAAFEADLDALARLLTGDPAGVRNRDGESLLHLAATSPFPHAPHAIDLLVTRGKVPIDVKDTVLGRTPLHALAARRGWGGGVGQGLAVLAALLRHGADVNARERRRGATPLHLTVTANNLPLARALLLHGADPACLDRDGQTPLALARRLWGMRRCHNDPEASASATAAAMVELLLAHAAGDEVLLSSWSGVVVRGMGGQKEYENPLRFVKGPGVR